MERPVDDRFLQFARNYRWGTCASCPRNNGNVYPEFCIHRNRSDHTLTLEDLLRLFNIEEEVRTNNGC